MPSRCILTFACRMLMLLVTAAVLVVPSRAEPADARLPIPDEAAQRQASTLIREVFAAQYAEYDKARTSGEKATVAKRLLAGAPQLAGNANDQFVLLAVVRDMAADAGDAETALEAVAQIAGKYAVDADAMQVETLLKAAASAQLPEHRRAAANAAIPLITAAVDRGDFQAAGRLIDAAQDAARRVRDAALLRQLSAMDDEVETLGKAWAEVERSLSTLADDPTNPDANLAAGRYYCLLRGQWPKGMGMLALGSDAKLKALAAKELARPTDSQERMELADGWWELSEKATGPARQNLRALAAARYKELLPSLAGLVRTKTERRLATVDGWVPPLEGLLAGVDLSHLADKRILLIFAAEDELSTAKKACEKYGLKYDVAPDFDMNKQDYTAYHTIICGSNMMDYWGKSEQHKSPAAFQHVLDFVVRGGHLIVLGSYNGRNTEHLAVFGIRAGHFHTNTFEPAGRPTELLFRGNEDIVPADRHLRTAGNIYCSVEHTALLKVGPGKFQGRLALVTLDHKQGRVTFTLCEPNWQGDLWLITVLISWVSRGCPTGE